MPIKHQADSYRTIKGERYVAWFDDLGAPEHAAELARVKAAGVAYRVVRIGDFRRVFVRAAEQDRI